MPNPQLQVVVFCCNWAARGEVDVSQICSKASRSKLQVIPTMCSSRVDPTYVMEAFSKGADGVLIGACPPGDCHFVSGNHKTDRRVRLLKKTVVQMGIDPERLQLVRLRDPITEGIQEAVQAFTKRLDVLSRGNIEADKEPVAASN